MESNNINPIDRITPAFMALKPFQSEGVCKTLDFLLEKGHVYNASDPGCGKTIMTVVALNALKLSRILIVCPAVMRLTWEYEFSKWTIHGYKIIVATTPKDLENLTEGICVICSYEFTTKAENLKRLIASKFYCMVCDEAHFIKTAKAKRTKAILKGLWPNILCKICLSGTPFTVGVMDGYSIFSKMHPDFGTKAEYGARYSNPELTPWGIKYKGIKRSAELKELMYKNFMFRYKLKDVVDELPDTIWKKVILDKKYSHKEYEKEIKKLIEAGLFDFDGKPLPTHIASLRVLQGELKLPPIIEYISDMLDQKIPVVVFAQHTKIVDELLLKLKKYAPVYIDGRVKDVDRFKAITSFQEGKTDLFIGQYEAAGVGITLTRASECVLAEIPYGPSTLKQAVARLDRIGQKNTVTVHNFIVSSSIDLRIMKILAEKEAVFSEIF